MARLGKDGETPMMEIVDAIAGHDQGLAEEKMKRRVRRITEALRETISCDKRDVS